MDERGNASKLLAAASTADSIYSMLLEQMNFLAIFIGCPPEEVTLAHILTCNEDDLGIFLPVSVCDLPAARMRAQC